METTRNINATRRFGPLSAVRSTRSGDRPDLIAVIARVRRRWRLRLFLDGLLWTLALGTAVILLATWLLNESHFAETAVWSLRLFGSVALLTLVAHFCARPLRREVSDVRVALYFEEHEAELKSVLLAAVDAKHSRARALSPRLVEQLVTRALDACARVQFGDRVEEDKLRRATMRLGLALLILGALALWPPEFLRLGAPALFQPWNSAHEVSPYRIELAPGDIEIARGADQLISARIAGFDGDDVLLFTSQDDGASWQQSTMASSDEAGRYETFLFDLDAHTDYYVTGAGRQSATYRIAVAAIPAIESIELRYHFPAYTMLPPETSVGSGDITALRGTRVEVHIRPTIDIPGGALRLLDGEQIELQRGADASWVGEISVRADSAYRVSLQRASGIPVDASPEYRITALDDRFPSVSITSPGRDSKVSMVEEPVLKVRASDDQGIARLELVMSINGESEQRVGLLPTDGAPPDSQQVEAEHVVYLEDLGLLPGDLISYYVNAEDRAPQDAVRRATSDIFFYQVRPFSNNYRRAEQQGGGGGGGGQGGQQDGHLSEQQKQFVIATFKMIRDRNNFTEQAYHENLNLLERAQARIRDRVEAILRRLNSRAIVRSDARYQVVLEELPRAVEAMQKVEARLHEAEVEPALTDAQIALKHLQRADAQFRDINVSLANQGGGGAGGNSGFDDLANLFQLEMDKLRHQYDTVQNAAQQPTPGEVIDETLEKLRELARRQQQELERMLRRGHQAQGNNANPNQLALAEELEAMARQLERLSRNQPNQQLRQSIEQMRNAAQAMRRAAASATGSGTNNIDQAREAAENLREARRLLDQGRARQFSEKIERSLRRAEQAEKKQDAIRQDVQALDDKWGDKLKAQLDTLKDRKQDLSEALSELEGDLSSLSASARDEQPQASQSLQQALRAARNHRLQDRIGRTREMVLLDEREHALDNETQIQQGIGQMREHIEAALDRVGQQGNRGLERSLEELRDLARELRLQREGSAGGASGGSTGIDAEGIVNYSGDIERIAERLRELGRGLVEQGAAAGDIDPVLARIEALRQAQTAADIPASTLQHELALRALMELEYSLRRQFEKPEYPELLISEPTEMPDDYRQRVADYFRQLSE